MDQGKDFKEKENLFNRLGEDLRIDEMKSITIVSIDELKRKEKNSFIKGLGVVLEG